MDRRFVTKTPEYQRLLACPHVVGVKKSVEYIRKPDMTEKDLIGIESVLTVTCDMTIDSSDSHYDGKAMSAIARAINELFVYAKTDRNFDRVVVKSLE
jgi:hypothetical protein